jgi:hypothetical protein
MVFQKNAFSGAVGLWSVIWCSAGSSLVISPDAPGPLAYLTGLTRPAMATFLGQNGIGLIDDAWGLFILGLMCVAVGAGFSVSLYAAGRRESRILAIGSCGAGAFLVLLIGGIGASDGNWAVFVDTLMLGGLALAAVIAAMDKHENMPMMPAEPHRFHAALVERMAQEQALELYLESCRTSSRTSRDFGSGRRIPSGTRRA